MVTGRAKKLFLIGSALVSVLTFTFLILPQKDSGITITYSQLVKSHLCLKNKGAEEWTSSTVCPPRGIVTSPQGGRLGNQMWESASVWAMAKISGLEPYLPCCMKRELEKLLRPLSIVCLEAVAHCPVANLGGLVNSWENWNGSLDQSIVLKPFTFADEIVVSLLGELRGEFQIKDELVKKGQEVLRGLSSECPGCVYIGVHVRRNDYFRYAKHKFPGSTPATTDYYLLAMDYFEHKFGRVFFVVTSDDAAWCKKTFAHKKNVAVVSKTVLQDLAILASCNHSIIDYGTYGTWAALLAGGETVYYNLTNMAIATRVGRWLSNWHSYTYRESDTPIFDVSWERE